MHHSLLYLIFLFLISCTENRDTLKNANSSSTEEKNQNLIETPEKEILVFGTEKFEITPSEDTILWQGFNTSTYDNRLSKTQLLVQHNNVERRGDSLIFKTKNSPPLILENFYPEGEETFSNTRITYEYIQSDTLFHSVLASAFESYWYVLVNKNTGDTTHTQGISVLSPDGNYLLAGNPDIDTRFTNNCLELFKIVNGKPKLIGTQLINDWAPYSIKWLSTDKILITAGNWPDDSEYSKMEYSNLELTRIKSDE